MIFTFPVVMRANLESQMSFKVLVSIASHCQLALQTNLARLVDDVTRQNVTEEENAGVQLKNRFERT